MSTIPSFVFVYSKGYTIQVFSIETAKEKHDELLKDGWQHSATLDACAFIKHLYDNHTDVSIIESISSLYNIKHA